MIEKLDAAHKVGIDQEKQTLLTKAGIDRYGEPQASAYLALPVWRLTVVLIHQTNIQGYPLLAEPDQPVFTENLIRIYPVTESANLAR
jgi:hypothetical protein